MSCFLSSVSRAAVVCALSFFPAPLLADSFYIFGSSINTDSQFLTGTQSGYIVAGGQLATSGTGVTLGVSTGPEMIVTNNGTIFSGNRAIDTTSNVTGNIAVVNKGYMTAADDTFRLNGAFAAGRLYLENTGSMFASGGQVLDFDAAVAASADVTIMNRGLITSGTGGSDAIRFGGGTIGLYNFGTIQSLAGDKHAIAIDTDSNIDTLVTLNIRNFEGGLITSGDDVIKIAGTPASTSTAQIYITNEGTIRATGMGQGINLGVLVSTGLSTMISNRATGLITTADNDAIAAGMKTIIHNYGQIVANYTVVSADAQSYSGVKFDGVSGTVNNYDGALISGSYHGIKVSGDGNAVAIYNSGTIIGRNGAGVSSNGVAPVENWGTITGRSDAAASFGDGDGIAIEHVGTITNYGVIQGLGSRGTRPGDTLPSTSEGIAIGGGVITNFGGGVHAGLISGANNGILAAGNNLGSIYGALTVTNYGTIQGLDGYGIQVINDAGFSTTITNYGTISGTTAAVAMGNGNDLFVYATGSSVVGAVLGQGGTDTFRLGWMMGSFDLSLLGDTATYRGFEKFDLAVDSIWTVTGTSSFSGATSVSGASLILDNASLASSVVSVAGAPAAIAVLSGTGTVGGLVAGHGAIIAPGDTYEALAYNYYYPTLTTDKIGTLNVAGNAAFADGSTYAVSVNSAGQSDRIAVTGSTTLASGSTVAVTAASGTYDFRQTYTILTSAGGVSGTFGSVSSNFAFLTPTLSYDATDVFLTLTRNDAAFASVASSPNARGAAAAAEAGGPGTALYQAVVGGSPETAQAAFQTLSGEAQASAGSNAFNTNQ
ncbi:beta strand repeat-containing protein, partial [Azorhizobium oxalatiphilum]|uniref:beta strand repeat-containing protein n=1 Tax=Azorhizobium oxalatiphilum TaxID=980631 RepID=UPI001663BF3A